LPKREELKTYLKADLIKDSITGTVASVKLSAKGLDENTKVTILIDGIKINDSTIAKTYYDKAGNTIFFLKYYLFKPGGHTIILEQNGEKGVKEATTIIIPLNDEKERYRK
jgi:hypothetical protein